MNRAWVGGRASGGGCARRIMRLIGRRGRSFLIVGGGRRGGGRGRRGVEGFFWGGGRGVKEREGVLG